MTENHTFIVDQFQQRLDQYLVAKLPDLSRSKIQYFIKIGQITIDGKTVKASCVLHGNETVKCCLEPVPQNDQVEPESMDLEIIFEDDHLAAINKPSGLIVHPGSGNWTGTLLNGLKYHFKQLSKENTPYPGIVHRLDKDTSGVILIAKNDQIHGAISDQFNKRMVIKEYLALAWGNIEDKGEIEGQIGRNPRKRQYFTMVKSGGRTSFTKYELLESLRPLSLVKLYPKTGRTHQLRVHLKSIGHPIFCDEAYGGGKKKARSFHVKYTQLINCLIKSINRVALHAQLLEITHPATGKKITFNAPIPKDMQTTLDILKK